MKPILVLLIALLGGACRAVPVAPGTEHAPTGAAAHTSLAATRTGGMSARTAPAPAADRAGDRWGWLVKPYLFASGLEGTVGIRAASADVEADFDDLLESLKLGAMIGFELLPPASRWTVLADFLYVELEKEGTAPGPAATEVDGTIEQFIAELAVAYELLDQGRLELLGGLRSWYVAGELEADLPAGTLVSDESVDWVDPLVGVRSRLGLTDRLDLVLRGDIGGFGVGSELTWNLGAALAWSLSDSLQLALGYRHLDVDYDDDIEYGVAQSGPVLGVVLGF